MDDLWMTKDILLASTLHFVVLGHCDFLCAVLVC